MFTVFLFTQLDHQQQRPTARKAQNNIIHSLFPLQEKGTALDCKIELIIQDGFNADKKP